MPANNFYRRFAIDLPLEEAQRRFVNRALNMVFEKFYLSLSDTERVTVKRLVTTDLGERTNYQRSFESYIDGDFQTCLRALEALAVCFPPGRRSDELERLIDFLIKVSGIKWSGAQFHPSGAKELDDALVNSVLDWLQGEKYHAVRAAYAKAIGHLVDSAKRPHLLSDVITDSYEALESLAKVVTGNERKDLSANREAFLSKLRAPDEVRTLLKEYIAYGCEYRHGSGSVKREPPSEADAEMYVYMTGALIRRAVFIDRKKFDEEMATSQAASGT
jgi:hypothetical protein